MSSEGAREGRDDSAVFENVSHEQARLLISKAWDGELSEAEEQLLHAHLATCATCAEATRRMHSLLALLDETLKKPES